MASGSKDMLREYCGEVLENLFPPPGRSHKLGAFSESRRLKARGTISTEGRYFSAISPVVNEKILGNRFRKPRVNWA